MQRADELARRFLKIFDDEMVGAPHDIVSTITIDEVDGRSLTEVLLGAVAGKID